MTEAEARVLLRDRGGLGGLEAWIADGARRLDRHRRVAGLELPARGHLRRSARQRQRAGRRRPGGVGRGEPIGQRGKVGMMPAIAVTTMLT
jgi:hypothetical protein